jgi:hypothetical protein
MPASSATSGPPPVCRDGGAAQRRGGRSAERLLTDGAFDVSGIPIVPTRPCFTRVARTFSSRLALPVIVTTASELVLLAALVVEAATLGSTTFWEYYSTAMTTSIGRRRDSSAAGTSIPPTTTTPERDKRPGQLTDRPPLQTAQTHRVEHPRHVRAPRLRTAEPARKAPRSGRLSG